MRVVLFEVRCCNFAGGSPAEGYFSCPAKQSNQKKRPPVRWSCGLPCAARRVGRLRNSPSQSARGLRQFVGRNKRSALRRMNCYQCARCFECVLRTVDLLAADCYGVLSTTLTQLPQPTTIYVVRRSSFRGAARLINEKRRGQGVDHMSPVHQLAGGHIRSDRIIGVTDDAPVLQQLLIQRLRLPQHGGENFVESRRRMRQIGAGWCRTFRREIT